VDYKWLLVISIDEIFVVQRLISLSFGENSLTQERWGYVTSLEKARTARLQSNEKGNNHY